MGKTQYSYVERKHSESGAAGSAIYDLPESGYMPELILKAYSTPTGASDLDLPLVDAITKIEVIDGGRVLKSLSAHQVKALSMIHKYKQLASLETNDNDVEQHDDYHILLGAVLNGTNYAPEMSNFRNPQIRLTWDYSDTTTAFGMACDADTTPVIKFSVIAKIIREGGNFSHGYVNSQVVREWTNDASITTKTELPVGDPLIGIGLEGGYTALDFEEDFEQAKLDFNHGDWVPFDFYEEEIYSSQNWWHKGPFQYSWCADVIDNKELDTHMGILNDLHVMSQENAGRAFEYQASHMGVETLGKWDLATPTVDTTFAQAYLTSIGQCPFHMWYCPASAITGGDKDTIDTAGYKRADITTVSGSSASTSSTPAVIAEYLKT